MSETTIEQVRQARAEGALVVDVREPNEYATGHVPQALSMPLGILPVRMGELPKDQPVYVICQKGGRSAQAAELLTAAGFDARSVAGGTDAWVSAGQDVETGAPRG